MKAIVNILFTAVSLVIYITDVSAQTTFFVSPKGKNTNIGNIAQPFADIEFAKLQARKVSGSVLIYLLEGNYYLTHPVVFTTEDARKKNETLTVKCYKNQKVIISGAVNLQLKWKKYNDKIWQAQVMQDVLFDELFVNGNMQKMARYPNYDAKAFFLGGTASDAISKERASHWQSPEGGYVHALHGYMWGDFHYIITGKNDKDELMLEGGWQNNRKMGMHEKYRFVENIYEELDTVNEWYYNKNTNTLYYYPPEDLDLNTATIETPQIYHLFEFKGSEKQPVKNVEIEGLTLTHTLRTFMQNKELLLRSDWTIYRGGAVLYNGSENCSIKNCILTNLGGNALFFSNYNRSCKVSGCIISNIGASAICFVGDPNAVRSPSFEYNQFVPLAQIDRTPGPKTNNYPSGCIVYNNLMFELGQIEKQSAGVQLSMCRNITISHNTIYDVPRAGINVSEGTWGGHLIEYNDVFNTVQESGDHGSFNSWGRDRYWHPDKKVLDSIVENNFDMATLDVVEPIILRNNRFRCDHGWDIDLDDGSSNYRIYNNLCLNGGIKIREGVNRVIINNIMINNTFHPHVWFKNSNDIFKYNIVSAKYLPIQIKVWGKETDYNVFTNSADLLDAQSRETDKHSVFCVLDFENPKSGDFRIKNGSKAFLTGFKNFDMDRFGVVSEKLKLAAKKVTLPIIVLQEQVNKINIIEFAGANLKDLSTAGEQSATGMKTIKGVLVLDVKTGSGASKFLQTNDVILQYNSRQINNINDLLEATRLGNPGSNEYIIFRNQREVKLRDK